MSNAEWAIVAAFLAHAVAVVAALTKLVAWAAGSQAKLETRLLALEAKVDNDIAGRRIVAELRADVAAIKATLAELKDRIHRLAPEQRR
ncbi:MAG: hypothetical protein ACK4TP_10485 [Hyphomicrobium sp.]